MRVNMHAMEKFDVATWKLSQAERGISEPGRSGFEGDMGEWEDLCEWLKCCVESVLIRSRLDLEDIRLHEVDQGAGSDLFGELGNLPEGLQGDEGIHFQVLHEQLLFVSKLDPGIALAAFVLEQFEDLQAGDTTLILYADQGHSFAAVGLRKGAVRLGLALGNVDAHHGTLAGQGDGLYLEGDRRLGILIEFDVDGFFDLTRVLYPEDLTIVVDPNVNSAAFGVGKSDHFPDQFLPFRQFAFELGVEAFPARYGSL